MTLTGSLVFGTNGEITPFVSQNHDRPIIRAMMEGGTVKNLSPQTILINA